jgi:uncharacterized protein Yka (UPF0111/DUF47 family)
VCRDRVPGGRVGGNKQKEDKMKRRKLTKAEQKIDEAWDQRVIDGYMSSLLEYFVRTLEFLEHRGDKMEIMHLRNLFSRKIEAALKNVEEKAGE